MRKIALIAGAALLLGAAPPARAVEQPPRDAVSVAFKEPVGDRYVAVLNLVMGTSTLRKRDGSHYLFHIGDRGNQNDYAVFFANLPYVSSVAPLPRLSAAERQMPPVTLGIPLGNGQAATTSGTANPATRPAAPKGYVPGELLVKPKADVDPGAVSQFVASQGARLKSNIDGIDVQLYTLPQGLSVEEAQRRFLDSGLVETAEPNRTMSLPPQPGSTDTPVPPDNGGPGIYLSPDQLLGTHLLVRFRAGGPTPDLINLIYGTKALEQNEADQWRLALPPHVSPLVAARIFRLCPYVMQAEPAYGR